MNSPNFFIVGAPKCGTSALYAYLQTHPAVFLSRVKEPHHFCSDFPGMQRFVDRQDYLRLFDAAQPHQRAVGEASTHYLRSQVAIPRILDFQPQAKMIAMLRNPTDLAHSLHAQLLYDFTEDVRDFATAWRLQPARQRARQLPSGCKVPSECLYGQVAALGEQVERLLRTVPRGQVKLIFSDDFFSDPAACYRDVLEFLGLEHDQRNAFPRVNPTTTYRWEGLAHFLIHPPFPLDLAKQTLKRCFGWTETRLGRFIYRQLTVPTRREPMTAGLREELTEFFAADVKRLQEITGRDFSQWLDPQPSGRSRAA